MTEEEAAAENGASESAVRPSGMNPLWIISLFLGVAEVSAGTAAALTSGWIQGTLTVFFVLFSTAVAVGFFWILLRRPYVLYAPRDFTEPTSVTAFVQAHTLSTASDAGAVEDLVSAAIQAAFEKSAVVDAALSHSEDSLPTTERDSVIEQAVNVAKESLTSQTIAVNFGLAVGLPNDDDRTVEVAVDSHSTVVQFLESIWTAIDTVQLPPESYGKGWLLIRKTIPLLDLQPMRSTDGRRLADKRLLSDVGVEPPETLSVRMIPTQRTDQIISNRATSTHNDIANLPHFNSHEEFRAYVSEARLTVLHLRAIAESLGIDASGDLRKTELVKRIAEVLLGVDLKFTLDEMVTLPVSADARAIMGVVTANQVAAWHSSFQERLFGVNVRQYLQGRVAQNQVARSRGELNSQPRTFVVNDNGITILVDNYYLLGKGMQTEVYAEGASVVNGAQTVIAISEAYVDDPRALEAVHLLVRIVSRAK